MDWTPPPGSGGATPGSRPGGQGGGEWQDLGDFSDFFASLFGQGTGRRARAGNGAGDGVRFSMPGHDVEAELPVRLEELMRGGRQRITLEGGRSLDVDIPVGIRDGTMLRLASQGGRGTNGGAPGDLFLHLRMIPHPRYRVAGDDLEMDLPLWPWQAVLGATVKIDTPDGAVNLKVPPGTQSEGRLRLRGRGLPRSDGSRGDLYAVVRIVVPKSPTPAEREAYESLMRGAAKPADRPAEE
jgi:curved DNA-binding protein